MIQDWIHMDDVIICFTWQSIGLDYEKYLVVLNRCSILDGNFDDGTGYFRLNFIEEFHRFNDTNSLPFGDLVSH